MARAIDPSRTILLRRQFERDIARRLRAIAKAARQLIVAEDAFGIAPRKPLKLSQQQYAFPTNSQKIQAFQGWLVAQQQAGLLEVRNDGKPWSDTYIESTYKKGLARAFVDANKALYLEPSDIFTGTKEAFLRSTFFQAETADKVQMLATRSFEQLKGIGQATSQNLNRIFSEGLVNGYGPEKIARNIDNSISSINRIRGRRIARTELIYAHAEGQLDAFTKLGIDEVTAEVEWLTAQDDKVCIECRSMSTDANGNRIIYKVKDSHGLIPLHPNCRCAWKPHIEVPKKKKKTA